MSVSAFNRRWAAVILEALTRHGVQHICIAPGALDTFNPGGGGKPRVYSSYPL
jgi:hypothetical protein